MFPLLAHLLKTVMSARVGNRAGVQFSAQRSAVAFCESLSRGLPGGKLLSFASPKESNQRKGDPGSSALRAALYCSLAKAAAELALRAQTVLADRSLASCAARRLATGSSHATRVVLCKYPVSRAPRRAAPRSVLAARQTSPFAKKQDPRPRGNDVS
jgi:hypothetical protein